MQAVILAEVAAGAIPHQVGRTYSPLSEGAPSRTSPSRKSLP